MKSLGQKAQEFRLAKGWNTTQMAKAVGTSRQNIENLETKEVGQPRYLTKLATVIGTTVGDLLGQVTSTPTEAGAMGGTTGIRINAPGTIQGVDALVESLSRALGQLSAAQRAAVLGKIGKMDDAYDSPALKQSIAELLTPTVGQAGAAFAQADKKAA